MSKNRNNNNDNSNENNPFSLPDGYFGSFSKKMMHKIELAEELKEFEILSSLDKKLPFATPENYFSSAEVKSELSSYPELSAIRKENVFATPELYFETSAKTITLKIEIAEELKAYPILSSVNKENSFAVPQNYFEGLSHRMRGEIFASHTEESAVVKILHLVFSKKAAYAIAATLVISLGLYFYNSGTETVSSDCGTLACLDKKEIIQGTQLLNMDDDALMEMVNADKLSKNLKENLKQTVKEEETKTDKQTKEEYILENVDVNDIADEI